MMMGMGIPRNQSKMPRISSPLLFSSPRAGADEPTLRLELGSPAFYGRRRAAERYCVERRLL
jgi:hypothetical protein